MDASAPLPAPALMGVAAGALAGAGVFLLIAAVRGLPSRALAGRYGAAGGSGVSPGEHGAPPGQHGGSGAGLRRLLGQFAGTRGAVAVGAGVLVLITTRWLVAAAGATALVIGWRGLGGAASERQATARLEGLAIWTESLRDTVAGAVGLEQAIPASLRVASPTLAEPLARLVDRLHTRMPMPEALRRFAGDLDDPGADLIVAALIINSRLRGPGLRDLLSALSGSVREELDMRRKVTAQRRSTRRSVQIVVGVSVGMALALAAADRGYMHYYNGITGQLVLAFVASLYAASFLWLRRLARYDAPERLLATRAAGARTAAGGGAGAGGRT